MNPPKFCILLKGFDCVVPIQFLNFFENSSFFILSPCACTTNIDFVFAIFFNAFSSPSKSVIIISGIIPFSTKDLTELSAAIFTDFLKFFNFGMAVDNEGPEPITNTVFPLTKLIIFSLTSDFFKIEFKRIADSLSFFSLYLNSFKISEYRFLQPDIII